VSVISKKTFINEEIRAQEVRVIGTDGVMLGVMNINAALQKAEEEGYDLVEISPDSVPPVCKIMDYGKYRFDRDKKEKEQRRNRVVVEVKEIQLKCNIDTHDLQTKQSHAVKFLTQGNKVKVVVRFYGREMTRTERGAELLTRFVEGCGDAGVVDKEPILEGRNMTLIMAPKKNKPTKGNNQNGQDQNS